MDEDILLEIIVEVPTMAVKIRLRRMGAKKDTALFTDHPSHIVGSHMQMEDNHAFFIGLVLIDGDGLRVLYKALCDGWAAF